MEPQTQQETHRSIRHLTSEVVTNFQREASPWYWWADLKVLLRPCVTFNFIPAVAKKAIRHASWDASWTNACFVGWQNENVRQLRCHSQKQPSSSIIMTIYSRASSRPSSSSSLSFCYIASSDDEVSIEVLLAAASVSKTCSSEASTNSSVPRRRILHPPSTVFLEPQESIVPYAQLCFHQDSNTISTMLVGSKTSSDGQGLAPKLTLSSDSDDDDESGWSTGYSSDESDYYADHHHRSHGVVWISREWWRATEDEASSIDERALLPGLRASRSESSEESTFSFLSLKSCGKLFCHSRKVEPTRPYLHHHASMQPHHLQQQQQYSSKKDRVDPKKDPDQRVYSYQLLKN